MSAAVVRGLILGSLIVIVAVLLWPPISPWGASGAVPVAGLAAAGLRPPKRWGGWVTVLMIPYLAVATMNIVAGPMPRSAAILFGSATVIAGLGGLDWLRRTGTSLRA
ncbi:MAG: hypothetical protein QNJ73_14920 [Gammaproteobacteria bacterium]|nr:hypothetical protein [Gammaproteobacteria bacterium]